MNTNKLLAASVAALGAVAATADSSTNTGQGLDWLVGHWCGERNGAFIEELWLPPRGDVMLGLSHTVKGGKTSNFEYMRIEQSEGVVVFIAQPQGEPPVPFRLAARGADWARFENLAHEFPKRVEYRRTVTGLHAEIAGPGKDGEEAVIPFDYGVCQQA